MQRGLQVFVGATLVANIDNSRLKSLLQIIEPLRSLRLCEIKYLLNV